MAQILAKVLDAILANVELTIVNGQYLEDCRGGGGGVHRDHSSRFKAYIFFSMAAKNEENRTMEILDI